MGISMEDSKLDEFARLISAWPGLMAKPDRALIDDSLVLLEHLGAARTLVDVGSGAGLPGTGLKIARPGPHVPPSESDQPKAPSRCHASAPPGRSNVEALPRRAEEAGHDPMLREKF